MPTLFCRCKYCQMQNRRVWTSLANLVRAVLWLIYPTPAPAPVRIRADDEPS